MNHSAGVSPRSLLIAGVSAAVLGAGAITPVGAPAPSPARIEAAVELTSLASGWGGVIDNLNSFTAGIGGVVNNLATGVGLAVNNLNHGIQATYSNLATGISLAIGNLTNGIAGAYTNLEDVINTLTTLTDGPQASIKRAYDKAQVWPEYAADWAQFSLALIPGLWWAAPSVAFGYKTSEPLIRAGAYSFADVVGLDFAQFARDISDGIKTSAANAAVYGKAWADSFVAVPPLPPYPGPLPNSLAAQDAALALPAAAADSPLAAPAAGAVTGGIESGIKNSYNAVEPWVAWGFQVAQWGLSFVPVVSYLAPAISLGYYTTEPLVQAGVYALADVLGLNFAQIGPDVRAGLQQAAQNLVTYALGWVAPLPPFPPKPGAAVTVAPSVPAAAAIAADEPVAPAAPVATAAETTNNAAAVDDSPTPVKTTSAVESATPQARVNESVVPPSESDPAASTTTPTTGAPAETAPPAQVPSTGDAAAPSRGAHLGHRSPTAGKAAPKAGGAESSAQAGRSSR